MTADCPLKRASRCERSEFLCWSMQFILFPVLCYCELLLVTFCCEMSIGGKKKKEEKKKGRDKEVEMML